MDPLDPARKALESERLIGGYRIVREIGRGSMGVVYEATDEEFHRRVALKLLIGSASIEEKAIRRFLREAELLTRVSHPNIVPIYRFGEERGTHFYAMRLVDGETVASLLRHGPIEARRAAGIARQAALALDCAHRMTIIHRDIKPANLILEKNGNALLTDFGLATHDRAATITDSGALVGTPMYMSPEQVTGLRENVDARSDVYSLGATLYEMLTGRPPYESDNVQSILRQIVEVDPRLPRRHRRSIPRDLETITIQAMQKRPDKRYASALALAEDLGRFLEGRRVAARRPGPLAGVWRQVRRRPGLAAGIALLGILLGLTVTWSVRQALRQSSERAYQDLLNQAAAAERSGDGFAAKTKLDEAIARRPADPLPWIRRALVRARAGDPDGAREDFRRAADQAPRSAESWVLLGGMEQAMRNRDAAVAAFEEAKRREPGSTAPFVQLAYLAMSEGDFRRAQAELEEANRVTPNDPKVIQTQAVLMERRGLREEADRYVKMFQLLNPLKARPSGLGPGMVDSAQKQLSDIAGLTETIKKTPEVASSVFEQLRTTWDRAALRDRIQTLSAELSASADGPHQADLRLERAEAYLKLEDFDGAAYDYLAASQASPKDPEPWRRLARLHLDAAGWPKRDLKEAIRCAERAAELDPGAPACQEARADAYLTSGRLDDAARVLDDLLARTPAGPARERFAEKRSRCAPDPARTPR